MIGPSLQRLHTENVGALVGLTLELYAILEQVDRYYGNTPLKHMDMICDLLYPFIWYDIISVASENFVFVSLQITQECRNNFEN